jgi:hypothetical protein
MANFVLYAFYYTVTEPREAKKEGGAIWVIREPGSTPRAVKPWRRWKQKKDDWFAEEQGTVL